ncbi:hypothetical protein BDA99DRAFT_575681 [Phascolomyces articulosus]|uniref:Uncharacterized protein n=1 Tax=Phascolomyces articulosus TaxID=60185 RepID=A0AAD5JZQ0_9FUNG|nr:hypothetical protein BDA99DRAFT_575681 [Phascolomyces articulosus]
MNDFYKQAKPRTSKKRSKQPYSLTSTGPLVKNKQETVQTTLQPYKHRSIGQEQARNDPNNLTALQTPVHWSRTSKKRSKQPYSLTSTGPLVKLELNHNSNHNNKVFYCLGLFF